MSEPGFPAGPVAGLAETWKESLELQRLVPYVKLTARAKNDGAPPGDLRSFNGPINITSYDAYRVIDPPADAKTLDLTLTLPRAPTRQLRFVDPDGHAIPGVTVHGLVGDPWEWRLVFDGAEAEAVGLEPGKPRELIATSNDRKYAGMASVSTDDPQPKTIRLERAGSLSGRLVDEATGRPLAGYPVTFTCKHRVPGPAESMKTDANGRFLIPDMVPGIGVSISFKDLVAKGDFGQPKAYQPDSLRDVIPAPGAVRDLGDIRIKAVH